jgi:hypothetical protein
VEYQEEKYEVGKFDRWTWVAIALLAAFLIWALNWPAWAETNQLTFCDRQDEITAVAEYGDDAVDIINATFPNACTTLVGTYVQGKTVDTVRARETLLDIVPVLIYGVGWGNKPVEPVEQWVALVSPLVEVTWKPEYSTVTEAERLWFQNAWTTPEAFNRFGWQSCCSHADRYVTQFRTNENKDTWWYLKDGKTWEQIPDFIIHWEEDPKMPPQLKAEGVLFVYRSDGRLTCFWPPDTGG